MKKTILVAIMVLASLTAFSQNGEKNFNDQNYIEVTGNAKMQVAPNEIYLKILVNEKDFKGKQNLQEIEKRMVQKLSEIGIDVSKQLAIKDMASNFQKYWLKRKQINSSREYQLKVKNAETAGEVIRGLNSLGISDISIEKVENSDIQKYRTEVKIKAIKAAQQKASALANAIGQKIGKAIFIREVNNHIYGALQEGVQGIVARGFSKSGNFTTAQPNIDFEKIKLQYSIFVRFALE